MTRRRDNYDGTYYLAENSRWRAQIQIHGKRKSKSFPNKELAKEWLDQMRKRSTAALTSQGIDLTFHDYVTITWLPIMKQKRSPSYYNDLKRRLERDLLPVFGEQALHDITPHDIQNYLNEGLEDGRGTRALELDFACMRKVLNDAEKAKHIQYNPARGVIKPKHVTAEYVPLTPDQARSLIQYLMVTRHPLRFLFTLALHTGMRVGELLGLTWADVDLNEGVIHVNRQVKPEPGGGYRLAPPKTKRSRRKILMSKAVYDLFHAQREVQARRMKFVDENPRLSWHQPSVTIEIQNQAVTPEFVFTSEVGSPLEACNLLKRLHRVLDECGLPRIRIHDLRHTAATIWLAQGIDIFKVSRLLGHESVKTTGDIYGHLFLEGQQEAVDAMEEVLELIEIDLNKAFLNAPKMPRSDMPVPS